jgi:hypothetical protein
MLARRASTPADSIHVTEASQDQSTACTSSATDRAPDPKLDTLSDQNEAKIPSELIANCIATLFMIQVNSNICSIIFYLQSINMKPKGLMCCNFLLFSCVS